MKLNELLNIMNDNQFVDVYYEDDNHLMIKCASYNGCDSIDEKFNEAEVLNISVTKYNTLDILIEKIKMNKRYRVRFDVPTWFDFTEERELEFEDDEDEDDIRDAIEEEFEEWINELLENMRADATKETIEVEEY